MFARLSRCCRWAGVLVVIVSLLAFAANGNGQTFSFQPFPNNATHSSAAVAEAIANVPTNVGVAYDPIGQTNDLQIWDYGTLVYTGPVDVSSTLQRIRDGYSVVGTESNDGGFFNFYPNELPNIPRMGNNYYMEFVVWPYLNLTNGTYYTGTPAYGVMTYPGSMRLLIGLGGEVYFTGDHYGQDGTQKNAYYVNPAPAPGVFRITRVTTETNNICITWQTVGGSPNVVQATMGTFGSYSNNFTNLSPIIVPNGGDLTSTNYIDVGGATNNPARFYRVRLVP